MAKLDIPLKNGKIVDIYGNIFYYKDDQLHSYNDEPALISAEGDMYWCENDKLHRLTGPAKISHIGLKTYFIDGSPISYNTWRELKEVKKAKLQKTLDRILKE
jgi:hypothetical protein